MREGAGTGSTHSRWVAVGTLALIASIGFPACSGGFESTVEDIFGGPVLVRTAPPLPSLAEEQRGYQYPDLKNPDGSITRVLWLSKGLPEKLDPVLKEAPEWKACNPNIKAGVLFADLNVPAKWKEFAGAEPLVLRGKIEDIDACTRLVNHILTSVPLILIEVRVVEVLETDQFGLGFDWFVLDTQDQDITNPLGPLTPGKRIFDRGSIGRGIPNLPGVVAGGIIPDFITELGVISDDIQVDLVIRALSMFTKVDVVNAPNVVVLHGHTANISAGQEIPYFTATVSGGSTNFTTVFKKVGVSLDVLPTLVRPDRVRLAVNIEVQNVTGASTVVTSGAATTNPIIASRNVGTTLDVKDGATVVLGGLLTTSKIEVRQGVPFLSEIPILGLFFSGKQSQDMQSNLIFFLTPKLITASGKGANDVIEPPGEGETLDPPIILPPQLPSPERKD